MRCRVGRAHDMRPPDAVAVVADDELVALLEQASEPFIRVTSGDEQAVLVERWGLRDANIEVRTEVAVVESGEREPLGDAYPLLRPRLESQQRGLLLQACSEIRLDRFTDAGRISEPQPIVVADATIYYRDDIDERRRLLLIAGKLGVTLTEADVDAIFRNLQSRRVKELRAAIRKPRTRRPVSNSLSVQTPCAGAFLGPSSTLSKRLRASWTTSESPSSPWSFTELRYSRSTPTF